MKFGARFVVEIGHFRWRWWWRGAEEIFEHVFAALDRRGAGGVRSDGEIAAVAEDAAWAIGRQRSGPSIS